MERLRRLISTSCLFFIILAMTSTADAEDRAGAGVISASPAGTPLMSLTLDEAADIAIENSHKIAAQHESAAAASEAAASAGTQRFPQISLQGQNRYISKIGQITIPGGTIMDVGTHNTWSVGPVLDWVAWDAGSIAKNAKSLRHTAYAQDYSTDATKRNVLLNARMAYFSVQLASEQLRLVADALDVARSQYQDVSERTSVGSQSRLDLVTAHQEVADRELDFENAISELASQVRALIAILALDQEANPSFPASTKLAGSLKSPPVKPDFLLNMDQAEESISRMRPRAEGTVEIPLHPEYQSAHENNNAAVFAYKSTTAKHWPKFTVQGKSTYDYPNFAEMSRVQQNTLTLGVSIPFIDWGMISKDARSKKHQANAALEQLKDTEIKLAKDLGETKDSIAVLRKARETSAVRVKDAVEAARLVFEEYIAGHVIFLEVQRANYRALQAKVDAARTDAQLLGQMARMESLITDEGEIR